MNDREQKNDEKMKRKSGVDLPFEQEKIEREKGERK